MPVRCPNCDSTRIVVVLAPRRHAWCNTCGARWVQEGSYQYAMRRPVACRRTDGASADPNRAAGRPRAEAG
ncbi:MAG: hypothetical protein HY658_15060 [Actinobacteria bacterium]|nr:hypothetical protein [Actinomycetota bacterium]